MEFILFIIVGLASGLLGGLLGIGGGMITVPALYTLLYLNGFMSHQIMQIAVVTSLAAAVVTTLVSSLAQWRKKAVDLAALKFLAPGLILGCALGAVFAKDLSSDLLKVIFGAIAIFLGIYFLISRAPRFQFGSVPNQSLSIFGLFVGFLSSLLGIGGGSMVFPILLGFHLSTKNASATASVSTLISTFVATIVYLALSYNQTHLPHTIGFINLPAFFLISIGSIVTSPVGVNLSHTLDVELIKKIFGLAMVSIGISMCLIPSA